MVEFDRFKYTVNSYKEPMQELKSALMAVKPKSSKDTPPPTTPEPEYSRDRKPTLKRGLKRGDSGEAVYWVQRRLKELGYYKTKCTGSMKNQTVKAVKAFQKDHGFSANGNVTQQLIDAMAEAEKITPVPQETPAPD